SGAGRGPVKGESSIAPRQDDPEGRPGSRLAFDLDAAAMGGHDAVADREAQPGARANVLGGKERIENSAKNVGLDPATVIADRDDDVIAIRPRGYPDVSLATDRITRV